MSEKKVKVWVEPKEGPQTLEVVASTPLEVCEYMAPEYVTLRSVNNHPVCNEDGILPWAKKQIEAIMEKMTDDFCNRVDDQHDDYQCLDAGSFEIAVDRRDPFTIRVAVTWVCEVMALEFLERSFDDAFAEVFEGEGKHSGSLSMTAIRAAIDWAAEQRGVPEAVRSAPAVEIDPSEYLK